MATIKQVKQVSCRGKPLKDEELKTEEFKREENKQIELILWYEIRPEEP